MAARPNAHTRQNTAASSEALASPRAPRLEASLEEGSSAGPSAFGTEWTDAEARDLLSTIEAASKDGIFDYWRSRDRVIDLLRYPRLPPSDALPEIIVANDCPTALQLLKDRTIPLDRRLRLTSGIARRLVRGALGLEPPGFEHTWEDWQPILRNYAEEPELAARVLDIIAEDKVVNWADILTVARAPGSSLELLRALYQALWRFGVLAVIRQQSLVDAMFTALLEMPDAPAIADAAFSMVPDNLEGKPSPPVLKRIIALLNDESLPLRYRVQLTVMLARSREYLDAATRNTVIDVQIAGLQVAADFEQDQLWESILQYASMGGPQALRSLAYDERLALSYRLSAVGRLDHRAMFRFAREVELDIYDRINLALGIGRLDLDIELTDQLRALAWNGGKAWHDFITIPEFLDPDIAPLVRIAASGDTPPLVQAVARAQVKAAIKNSPGDFVAIYEALLGCLRNPEIAPESQKWLFDAFRSCGRSSIAIESIHRRVLQVLSDPDFPVSHKVAILDRVSLELVAADPRKLWDVVEKTASPGLRGALLDRFVLSNVIGGKDPAVRAAATLLRASDLQSSQRVAAEDAWQQVAPVKDLLGLDLLGTLNAARASASGSLSRRVACGTVKESPFPFGQERRLWTYLAEPANRPVWEEPDLREAIVGRLERMVPPTWAPVVTEGPTHPLWPGLMGIALIPDAELSYHAVAYLPYPSDDSGWKQIGESQTIPDEAHLAVYALWVELDHQQDVIAKIAAIWESVRSHREKSELTNLLIQLALKTPVKPTLGAQTARLLTACSCVDCRDTAAVIDGLRFALLHAELADDDQAKSDPDRQRTLEGGNSEEADPLPTTSFRKEVQKLKRSLSRRVLTQLPGVTDAQIAYIVRETTAPIFLVRQYQRQHPLGLPLLGEAISQASQGDRAWKDWKFDRPDARRQLADVTASEIARWKEDLAVPLSLDQVSEEVTNVARGIRDRFATSLRNREVPEELRELVAPGAAEPNAAVLLVRRYRALRHALGLVIGGKASGELEQSLEGFPEAFTRRVRAALGETASETMSVSDRRRRHDRHQALLALRAELGRAIDLLRLLHCDERALARNQLRVTGEPDASWIPEESALAHFHQMIHAFGVPATREQRQQGSVVPHPLEPAFRDALNALRRIDSFAPDADLVACECSDFKTLIEIGNNPYGQGFCQDYTSSGSLNRALLAYVVDAMTKAIVVRSRTSKHFYARAIVRLGIGARDGHPVLVLEPTYAAGGEVSRYEPLLKQAARAFAQQRGWRLAVPCAHGVERNPDVLDQVHIPASQNRVQYEDGHDALIDAESTGLVEGEYRLRVSYVH